MDKLSKEDIIRFAEENHVSLTSNEVDILYREIKTNWYPLLYNPKPIFERVKEEVSPSTYQNILYFYDLYSKKLHPFLNFH